MNYLLLPFVLSVPPIVGWAIGSFFDEHFGTTPYIMYLFLVLGVAAALREFTRIIKTFGE